MSDAFQIIRKIRDSIILNLRDAFSKDPDYPYSDSLEDTKIHISDVTPLEAIKFPSIIVSGVNGDETRYLQDDFVQETNIDYVRGSGLDSKITIEILTTDGIERDELCDRVYQSLKDYKDVLADDGIAILRTGISPERRQFIGDRWFYTSGLTISIYSEWIEHSTSSFVTSISTSVTLAV